MSGPAVGAGMVIRGARIVDGTGEAPFVGDVGIRDGRIDFVRRDGEGGDASGGDGREVLDANGRMLTPGFVDPHTHYDAQLCWDPTASPSNLHGVTTVIGGNCGFSIAPLGDDDADYIRRMMAVSYTHLTLPTTRQRCRSRWSPYH